MTWEEWLATPGDETYKSDCGLGNHEDWFYTVMTGGTVMGSGSLEGTNLTLTTSLQRVVGVPVRIRRQQERQLGFAGGSTTPAKW